MNFNDITEFYSVGSKICVISHGEKVTGILKKLSPPSSVIVVRSDTGKPKIIDCEKIESIDYADEETIAVEQPSTVLEVSPVKPPDKILDTPLIYLPPFEQPEFSHRENIKKSLKQHRYSDELSGVVAEWNQIDNTFENAKKIIALQKRKSKFFVN